MRRILICCCVSIFAYLIFFAILINRPLSLGLIRQELLEKTIRLGEMRSPKIVIIAGSNGPYSHSCAVIGAMLNMPCENAGIAVGIGLDDILTRYGPLLHEGDVVYMPMELQQYIATRTDYRSGVDGAFLLHDDRNILTQLPPDRILGAIFCCNFTDLLDSFAEMLLAQTGMLNREDRLTTEYDEEGDRIDNDLRTADPALLEHPPRPDPGPAAILNGYGAAIIKNFTRQKTNEHIIVIGGLPTDFEKAPLSPETIYAISAIYNKNGGKFIILPNHSLYPVADFFNAEEHLVQPCQYAHSIAIAQSLAALLKIPVRRASPAMLDIALTCPGLETLYPINEAR